MLFYTDFMVWQEENICLPSTWMANPLRRGPEAVVAVDAFPYPRVPWGDFPLFDSLGFGESACQLNCPKWTGFHAYAAVTAAIDIQIGRFPWVRLHDGTRLAEFQSRTLLAGLTKIEIDADADQTRHYAEYT